MYKRLLSAVSGYVDDVVHAIEFLASSKFANGTIVKLDGGLRL